MTALIVAGLCMVAVAISLVVQRRPSEAPSQPLSHVAPAQLDRADFPNPKAPWLVVLFSAATCESCTDVDGKVGAMESSEVAVYNAEETDDAALHERYGITGVPICVIADHQGVVQRSFIGPVSATHLWAAAAELRDPGSVPQGCGAVTTHEHDHGQGSNEHP